MNWEFDFSFDVWCYKDSSGEIWGSVSTHFTLASYIVYPREIMGGEYSVDEAKRKVEELVTSYLTTFARDNNPSFYRCGL